MTTDVVPFPDWENNTSAGTDFHADEEVVNSGDHSCAMAADGDAANEGLKQEIVGFNGGNEHTARAWARTDGDAGEQAKLIVYNVTDDTEEGSTTGTDGATSFEELTVTFTPEDGKAYEVRIVHNGTPSDGDVVYFDDVEVVEGTSSTYGDSTYGS